MGMFIVSISSVVYPMLSKLSTENNKVEFNKSIVTAFSTVILLVIPYFSRSNYTFNTYSKNTFSKRSI